MSQIVLGKTCDEKSATGARWRNATLTIDLLLRTHLLVWASTGGGKSWLLRRLAEQLFGKVPVTIIDREGEFPTLREKHGYVLAGPGGETPADVRSAKLLAEKLLELRASAVCNLFELKHEARAEWVKTFLEAIIDAPKKLWAPRVIMIDEAHVFCPEKGQGESVAYSAVCDLVSVGRKRGLGVILATQRLSKLSKNATGEMYNQAAGPTASQADRDRAGYEMGISQRQDKLAFADSLRHLKPGQFFFQGRAVSMERILVQVGDVVTTHPEPGSAEHAAAPPPPPDKIKGLLPKLKDLPQAAEEKARTEAEFKAEIRSLKGQLVQAQRAAPLKTQTVVERVADERIIREAVEKVERQRRGEIGQLQGTIKRLASTMSGIAKTAAVGAGIKLPAIKAIELPTVPPARVISGQGRLAQVPVRADRQLRVAVGEPPERLAPGALRMLKAVAQWYEKGITEGQMAAQAGIKRRGVRHLQVQAAHGWLHRRAQRSHLRHTSSIGFSG